SALALTRKFHPPSGSLLANIDDLLHRFGNRALGDTILRLGRDPLRKLAPGDRLAGAASTALEYNVAACHLSTGIAAALHFNHPDDPGAKALQDRLAAGSVASAITEITGIAPSSELSQQILRRYEKLRQ
ncbi:MAG: hypothetical protein ACM30E_13170, partial [Nitrososphaerales archaeon]